ncbi:helix-turn-helix transcriptional regulator [Sphingopyxis italica]|nr:AlpA family phage regulatory protein [Sphingopyxis italica]
MVTTPCLRCNTRANSLEVISTPAEVDDPLVSLNVVKRIAGIGKTRIYALIRQQKFPKPYKPGGTSSRWSLVEINRWRDEQRSQ